MVGLMLVVVVTIGNWGLTGVDKPGLTGVIPPVPLELSPLVRHSSVV